MAARRFALLLLCLLATASFLELIEGSRDLTGEKNKHKKRKHKKIKIHKTYTKKPTYKPTYKPTTKAPTYKPTTKAPTYKPTTYAPTHKPTTYAPTPPPCHCGDWEYDGDCSNNQRPQVCHCDAWCEPPTRYRYVACGYADSGQDTSANATAGQGGASSSSGTATGSVSGTGSSSSHSSSSTKLELNTQSWYKTFNEASAGLCDGSLSATVAIQQCVEVFAASCAEFSQQAEASCKTSGKGATCDATSAASIKAYQNAAANAFVEAWGNVFGKCVEAHAAAKVAAASEVFSTFTADVWTQAKSVKWGEAKAWASQEGAQLATAYAAAFQVVFAAGCECSDYCHCPVDLWGQETAGSADLTLTGYQDCLTRGVSIFDYICSSAFAAVDSCGKFDVAAATNAVIKATAEISASICDTIHLHVFAKGDAVAVAGASYSGFVQAQAALWGSVEAFVKSFPPWNNPAHDWGECQATAFSSVTTAYNADTFAALCLNVYKQIETDCYNNDITYDHTYVVSTLYEAIYSQVSVYINSYLQEAYGCVCNSPTCDTQWCTHG